KCFHAAAASPTKERAPPRSRDTARRAKRASSSLRCVCGAADRREQRDAIYFGRYGVPPHRAGYPLAPERHVCVAIGYSHVISESVLHPGWHPPWPTGVVSRRTTSQRRASVFVFVLALT